MTSPPLANQASSSQLSIIVPSFNEELRLPRSLELIAAYVNASKRNCEVLVVDDGSTDRTVEVAASFSDRIANLRVLKNGKNRGKGYSVRHGMLEAKGEYVLFTDADLSAPIEEADKLLSALQQYDVAIGSRDRRSANLPESFSIVSCASFCGCRLWTHNAASRPSAASAAASFSNSSASSVSASTPNCCIWRAITGSNPLKFPCAGRIRQPPRST